ncbi:MAG TPA: phosphoribosylaminoimidazolesuccinocarboxamide synthase, partial [Leptospiraceae bacterium]|nr:phosphoribosylaminoimidazolesuccinocarboxamide synthase [Leptospiraceae bacterium]
YWALETYKKGTSPPSYDKQILRNYLESTGWNKEPPPPALPADIIQTLHLKYKELQRKLELCLSEK